MNQPVATLSWRCSRLSELTPLELARIYRARQQVFTIEQDCVYLDADEADEHSYHLAAWSSEHTVPLAYARLVDPGVKYAEPSMGRVITTAAARGTGLGRELVQRVLALSARVHPGLGIRISAQSRLRRFYNELGFEAVGADYMEDGIPHIEMLRRGAP
jgi:ElaA protein